VLGEGGRAQISSECAHNDAGWRRLARVSRVTGVGSQLAIDSERFVFTGCLFRLLSLE
jgi:hypothetical protein